MFGMDLQAKVRSISSKVKDDDGRLVRTSTLALQMEFTRALATGIDEDAQQLQELLCDGSLKSATMSMDGVKELKVTLGDGDDAFTIDGYGQQLEIKKANKEDAHPTATFSVGFPTEDDPVLWCLHHLEETVEVRIDKAQLEIPGTEAKPGKKGKAS